MTSCEMFVGPDFTKVPSLRPKFLAVMQKKQAITTQSKKQMRFSSAREQVVWGTPYFSRGGRLLDYSRSAFPD